MIESTQPTDYQQLARDMQPVPKSYHDAQLSASPCTSNEVNSSPNGSLLLLNGTSERSPGVSMSPQDSSPVPSNHLNERQPIITRSVTADKSTTTNFQAVNGAIRTMEGMNGGFHHGVTQDDNEKPAVATPVSGTSEREILSPEQFQRSEKHKRKQSQVEAMNIGHEVKDKVLKLSPEKLNSLTSDPESLPVSSVHQDRSLSGARPEYVVGPGPAEKVFEKDETNLGRPSKLSIATSAKSRDIGLSSAKSSGVLQLPGATPTFRPNTLNRAFSTPPIARIQQTTSKQDTNKTSEFRRGREGPGILHFDNQHQSLKPSSLSPALLSPMPASMPLPPLSIPIYLQLELSSQRPSQGYIHRSTTNDFPYESSRVKIERLVNFLCLPPQLEGILWFGTLACFDAWLYTFTILPLRLLRSFYVLGQSWSTNFVIEFQFLSGFVYSGAGRMWQRRRNRSMLTPRVDLDEKPLSATLKAASDTVKDRPKHGRHHRKLKSVPSTLLPDDKADILKGLLIICTCLILLRLDASRMYHWIRGQAAIKLYVIYNVLEVSDRLFSAIGQDVLECLFSREALERRPDGHSKILRPLWLFSLALVYTVVHSTSLFYQVITLNVAVNSYSNALITLLISNQFVEIKSTVFKKFEKENLFQLTCADVVERFQLWLMLTIIAFRNIVETGGLSVGFSVPGQSTSTSKASSTINASHPLTQAMPPRSSFSILPRSFTLLPAFVDSLTVYAPAFGHVLGPFLVVLGSEMIVDWLKHAYIGKFNNTRPAIYGRFLDVLAKDYYTNAFGDQNLTKRLGLPVIPLSCLFIRAGVQTYHMFIAAWMPTPMPTSSTSLSGIHEHYAASRASQPTSTTAALSQRFEDLLLQLPTAITSSVAYTNFTTILIFALVFLVLLAFKLVLGILLLSFARSRYRSMKEREKDSIHHVEGGRRVGGWGVVEVDDDKRRWIYDDDAAGYRALREREEREKTKKDKGLGEGFDKVKRYDMVAKRIW